MIRFCPLESGLGLNTLGVDVKVMEGQMVFSA
jgi:hypothetical protein